MTTPAGMRIIPDPEWTLQLLPDALAVLGIEPAGVIHVGAHHGEEVPVYQRCGFESITLVEPDPASCALIATQPWIYEVTLVRAACAPAGSAATFHRTADDVFSGLLPNPGQETVDTFTVATMPVSAVQADHPANVLVIDTQGTELDVLRSADLDSLDLVVIETQAVGPDAYGAYWPDLMTLAADSGWTPVIQWARGDGWADTLLTPRR